MPLYYQIFRHTQRLAVGQIETPFQVGRQLPEESDLQPICISDRSGMRRLIFASRTLDLSIPRRALFVQEAHSEFIVENVHEAVSIDLLNGRRIMPGGKLKISDYEVFLFAEGFRVWLGKQLPETPNDLYSDKTISFRTLDACNVLATQSVESGLDQRRELHTHGETIEMVKATLRAFREPPNAAVFYKTVVQSVIEMIDVDRALVLIRGQDGWHEHASAFRKPRISDIATGFRSNQSLATEVEFSRTLIQRMLESRRTTIVETLLSRNSIGEAVADGMDSFGDSMQNIERAVASPVFDDHQEIVAILYADKRVGGLQNQRIGDLEALLLEVLASGVSNSLLRQREEEFRNAASQFFSPRILDRLQSQRDLLDGRDAEVSVLFCDIRGFSTISHRVGPATAIAWINDVLTHLSECVLRYDGVLVDYIGDELMAMFGAPEELADHAQQACRAAVDMLHLVPHLNSAWIEKVHEEFGIGIGINSGMARVGNIGSRLKFKYGPLGSTVNIASRLERLTKVLGVSAAVGKATADALNADFQTRKLATARILGINEPVEIFELFDEDSPAVRELREFYEAALSQFCNCQFDESIATLDQILVRYPDDAPCNSLRRRAIGRLNSSDHMFDFVWELQFDKRM